MTTSYEGWKDEEELKTVPLVNNNNISDILTNSKSDDGIKNDNKNIFDDDINDEVEATTETTINAKVVLAMKKLQALYNDNANKFVEQTTKEKRAIKNLNFLIDIAMVTNDTKPIPEEPQTFNEAWDQPNENSHK